MSTPTQPQSGPSSQVIESELSLLKQLLKLNFDFRKSAPLVGDMNIKFVWKGHNNNDMVPKYKDDGFELMTKYNNIHFYPIITLDMQNYYYPNQFRFALVSDYDEPVVAQIQLIVQLENSSSDVKLIFLRTPLGDGWDWYYQYSEGCCRMDYGDYYIHGRRVYYPHLTIVWDQSTFDKLSSSSVVNNYFLNLLHHDFAVNNIEYVGLYVYPLFPLNALNGFVEAFEGKDAFRLDPLVLAPQQQQQQQGGG